MEQSFSIKEFINLWISYFKKENRFIELHKNKYLKLLAREEKNLNEYCSKFKVSTKTLFKIWIKYSKNTSWKLEDFIKNYQDFYDKFFAFRNHKVKIFLNYLENNLDYVIKNINKLPKDYREFITFLLENKLKEK